MQDRFRALLVTKDRERQSARVTELTDSDLMDGDVTVSVEYSTVNYKDGLAVTGKAPIIRKFPLIPGVDLAGRVLRSQNPDFHEGDRVVLNGYGLGEAHHGGFAERARVKSDWLIPLPQGISTAQAMAIGTAGFTAMLCVMALEKAGITPGSTSWATALSPPPVEPNRRALIFGNWAPMRLSMLVGFRMRPRVP